MVTEVVTAGDRQVPRVFDQNVPFHQDWLLAQLAPRGLDGFYTAQDIGDLLQGLPGALLASKIAGYVTARANMPLDGFLAWVETQRRRRADPQWQEIEDAARLAHSL